ncbi:aldolase [Rhodoferax sp.]|uniref:class II aldolase/adducin family protein n=1 Tax=Rhodoferax sp. TaxID=50421 RepID=UPI0025CC83ED|nr:aldolase [Rhodoferax sp.]
MSHWLDSLDAIREEVCRVGKSMFDRGLVHATAGNISVRLPVEQGGGYLITPTDACLGFLRPERLSLLDAQGEYLAGDVPSKTIVLHRKIYASASVVDAQVRCVIHTHSSYSVSLSMGDVGLSCGKFQWQELLPALTPYFVMKVGRVPLIPYGLPGSPEVAGTVGQCIEAYAKAGIGLRAVMLERLGPNVWHHSPAQAMAVLEELEETAKLYCWSHGRTAPLPPEQVQTLEDRFNIRWQ